MLKSAFIDRYRSSLDKLVGKFQLALYHQTNRDGPLYTNQLQWRILLQSMRQIYSKCSLVRFQDMTLGSALTTRDCPHLHSEKRHSNVELKTGDGWNPAEEELTSSTSMSCSQCSQYRPSTLSKTLAIHTKKTKLFRISLVITAVFLAWTKLCHKVLQKFQLCKDIEYSCLLFLLDEVIPLSFFHNPVTFRSGNLDDYTWQPC